MQVEEILLAVLAAPRGGSGGDATITGFLWLLRPANRLRWLPAQGIWLDGQRGRLLEIREAKARVGEDRGGREGHPMMVAASTPLFPAPDSPSRALELVITRIHS